MDWVIAAVQGIAGGWIGAMLSPREAPLWIKISNGVMVNVLCICLIWKMRQ